MSAPAPSVYVWGGGTVGQALARALREAGVRVLGIHRRRVQDVAETADFTGVPVSTAPLPPPLGQADVAILAVSDRAITDVARSLTAGVRADAVLLHCSGASPAEALRVDGLPPSVACGCMHPLQTFPSAETALSLLPGTAFGLEGDDRAIAAASTLVTALGAWSFQVPSERKALYHAAAVVAANHLVALADDAVALARQAGLPEEQALPALLPLIHGAVAALERDGLPTALTGPIARGDDVTVRKHLEAIATFAPERLVLYREAARRALAIARSRGDVDAEHLDAIQALLD